MRRLLILAGLVAVLIATPLSPSNLDVNTPSERLIQAQEQERRERLVEAFQWVVSSPGATPSVPTVSGCKPAVTAACQQILETMTSTVRAMLARLAAATVMKFVTG